MIDGEKLDESGAVPGKCQGCRPATLHVGQLDFLRAFLELELEAVPASNLDARFSDAQPTPIVTRGLESITAAPGSEEIAPDVERDVAPAARYSVQLAPARKLHGAERCAFT